MGGTLGKVLIDNALFAGVSVFKKILKLF